MLVQEISDRIDYALSKGSKGLLVDEYHKSLYMTRAQELFIEQILSTYEYGDRVRHILEPLIVTMQVSSFNTITNGVYKCGLESNIKSILFEKLNNNIPVIPMDWNDIHYTVKNPFREPDDSIAYRVTDKGSAIIYTSAIPTVYEYVYCKEPMPIVLEDLPPGLEVKGVSVSTTSEIHDDGVLAIIEAASDMIIKDKVKFIPDNLVSSPKQEKEN